MSCVVFTEPVHSWVYRDLIEKVDFDFPPWSEAILYHWLVDAPDVYAVVELPDGTTFAVANEKWRSLPEPLRRAIAVALAADGAS